MAVVSAVERAREPSLAPHPDSLWNRKRIDKQRKANRHSSQRGPAFSAQGWAGPPLALLFSLFLILGHDLAAATPPTTLVFAISLERPPLAFKREDVVQGLEVDLARQDWWLVSPTLSVCLV
ncbi:MAG: hypothetical protein VBE63_01805 [Lamprobacter sp.]|uniref:hypothetical protein n=1 Tax=Lamprobacter sp. TaxID=3100796 RepID=UPI002B260D26|nr:hypothetical protein [Lamprobacter sp.]MEA3638662.1 hypothetical protein [Lamprobacter sp.]